MISITELGFKSFEDIANIDFSLLYPQQLIVGGVEPLLNKYYERRVQNTQNSFNKDVHDMIKEFKCICKYRKRIINRQRLYDKRKKRGLI